MNSIVVRIKSKAPYRPTELMINIKLVSGCADELRMWQMIQKEHPEWKAYSKLCKAFRSNFCAGICNDYMICCLDTH